MSHVVIWSGGIDSTSLLYKMAGVSCRDYPVRALTVGSITDINEPQLKAEKKAQARFLKLAKKRGLHIVHERIEIGGKLDCRHTHLSELWLCHLFPSFHNGEEIHFGYIRADCFWGYRHEFEETFKAFVAFRQKTGGMRKPPVLRLDYEHTSKWELLKYLRENKIPDDCWWSCIKGKPNSRACGRCHKCEEIRLAREKFKRMGKKKGI